MIEAFYFNSILFYINRYASEKGTNYSWQAQSMVNSLVLESEKFYQSNKQNGKSLFGTFRQMLKTFLSVTFGI